MGRDIHLWRTGGKGGTAFILWDAFRTVFLPHPWCGLFYSFRKYFFFLRFGRYCPRRDVCRRMKERSKKETRGRVGRDALSMRMFFPFHRP